VNEADQNKLIIKHLDDLVPAIAAEFRGGNVEYEDLLAIGREGLTLAARSFDPEKSKFTTWATTKIRSAVMDAIKSQSRGEVAVIASGDSIEKIFDWDSWGEYGNAVAISEAWSKLDASPEELAELYECVQDRRDRFAAAFISLTGNQRKLVKWVFLDDPRRPLTQGARELGVSYFQATRMLRRALKIMREVITRMESNTESGGNTANGHPSRTGLHGCVPGTVAA
jgi:RNA polymerase sigma factor (sigma-70 family)